MLCFLVYAYLASVCHGHICYANLKQLYMQIFRNLIASNRSNYSNSVTPVINITAHNEFRQHKLQIDYGYVKN